MTKTAIALLIVLCPGIPSKAQQAPGQNSTPLAQEASPGARIQAAAKASSHHNQSGSLEVLTNTEGVDFGPYLKGIVAKVRENWYSLIPQAAQMKKGRVAIQFAILKSGEIEEVKIVTSAGTDLDRPALASITESSPFPALPEAFHGPYLALRFNYYYNPGKSDLDNAPKAVIGGPSSASSIQHASLIQSTADAHPIKYPKKAVHKKVDGIVRLVARIAPDGTVESVATSEGSALLGDAATNAVRKWRFQPAREGETAIAEQVRIRVEFRLDGRSIRSEVFPWESPAESSTTP